MKTIKMKSIKESEVGSRSIIQAAPTLESMVKGEGDTNYTCFNCGKVILETVDKGQVTEIVFKCPVCGELNIP